MTSEKDPYRYFRIESKELLEALGKGVLELERGTGGPGVVSSLLRLAHTLKGASRVVKQGEISECAHAIEEVLVGYREHGGKVSPSHVGELLRLVDSIGGKLKALGMPQATPMGAARAPADEPIETIRVEIRAMDALLASLTESKVHLATLAQEEEALSQQQLLCEVLRQQLASRRSLGASGDGADTDARARALLLQLQTSIERLQRTFATETARAERELRKALDLANELRLLPASAIFPSLERVARDAAELLGKRVRLEVTGGDNRLDAHVLSTLRDALIQVVRNAVAHGIESEAERAAAGKPAVGLVTLRVERSGNRIVFACVDDGKGIDVAAIRQVAVSRGLVRPAQAASLGLSEAIGLILSGGLSTSGTVNELSGRGVGLDLVREKVSASRGETRVSSERGLGTTVILSVPISIESLPVLTVEAAGLLISLPLDSVRAALRVSDSDIASTAEGESLHYEGRAVPFAPLAKVMRRNVEERRKRSFWSAIVVQKGASLAAIGVDRVVGSSVVIMRTLPTAMAHAPLVAGASFDREGNPQPVLNPEALIGSVSCSGSGTVAGPPAPACPILVIDDSLTTRMLEQRILESAGYQVVLADSAEEGLKKAAKQRFALFVVDLEMPGMNGFEFIEHVRADPGLSGIPAILVTSRASLEDRRRGELAGARAYIVKGEFDEGSFLRTIAELAG